MVRRLGISHEYLAKSSKQEVHLMTHVSAILHQGGYHAVVDTAEEGSQYAYVDRSLAGILLRRPRGCRLLWVCENKIQATLPQQSGKLHPYPSHAPLNTAERHQSIIRIHKRQLQVHAAGYPRYADPSMCCSQSILSRSRPRPRPPATITTPSESFKRRK